VPVSSLESGYANIFLLTPDFVGWVEGWNPALIIASSSQLLV
jgi:hypothetical protein